MSKLFLTVLSMSLSASWLIALVLVLRLFLGRAPRWAGLLLWGMVAARLLCPVFPASPLSLIPSSVEEGRLVSQWTDGYAGDIQIYHDNLEAFDAAVASGAEVVTTPEGGRYAVTGGSGRGAPPTVADRVVPVLSAVWAAGTAVFALHALLSWRRLRRELSAAVRYRDNIFQSERVLSPFVFGLFRPKIYLPFHLSRQELAYVVAHERSHLAYGDPWWKLLGFAVLAIHWFNPLVWLAYGLLCRDIELACDQRVIRELDDAQQADYSQALVACSVGRPRLSACPLAFGEAGVKERVRCIARYKKPSRLSAAAAGLVCVLTALCFLTSPTQAQPSSPFGADYMAGATVYSGAGSPSDAGAQELLHCRLTQERHLLILQDTASGNWLDAGALEEVTLTKDNFDAYFYADDGFEGSSAAALRRRNARAWRVLLSPEAYQSDFYYLLQQQDGSLYLALGLYDVAEADDPDSDDSVIREVFLLEPLLTQSTALVWFDYPDGQALPWDGRREINLDAFPGVTFRWSPEKVEAVTDTGILPLYTGMPIWNVFFADLTGDGLPELCSTLSIRSGVANTCAMVYDYANGASYALQDPMRHDYSLSLQDGRLVVTKRRCADGQVVQTAYLAYVQNTVSLIPTDPAGASPEPLQSQPS